MLFSLAMLKQNKMNLGQAEGHNTRLHPTKMQLPEPAWYTKAGHHEVMPWDETKLDTAKSLSKRKDAVLALQFVFTIGNQADWRELPTLDCLEGKPKKIVDGKPARDQMNAVAAGARAAMIKEFGEKNIVSIELHTDESTPHVHCVVTPITAEGKLQAKTWMNGHKTCAALRARLHTTMNLHIHSTYTPGEPSGGAYDASYRAGGTNAAQPEPSWAQKAAAAVNLPKIITGLKKQVELYKAKYDALFSRLKSMQKKIDKHEKELTNAKAEAAKAAATKAREAAEKLATLKRSAEQQITRLQSKNEELTGFNEQLANENNDLKRDKKPAQNAAFGQ